MGNRLKRINVGLVARFFMPRPLKKPCTNVVFPDPKSPERAITKAPFRLEIGNCPPEADPPLAEKLVIRRAIFLPSALVPAEEKVFKVVICFCGIKHERREHHGGGDRE